MTGALLAAFLLASHTTVTVDGQDYPVCSVEDCSDQPNQTGVWSNDGHSFLIIGEQTYPITR